MQSVTGSEKRSGQLFLSYDQSDSTAAGSLSTADTAEIDCPSPAPAILADGCSVSTASTLLFF